MNTLAESRILTQSVEKDDAEVGGKADKEPVEKPEKVGRRKKKTPKVDDNEFRPKVTMPHNKEPTYYVGGGNGVPIIIDIFEDLGWRRTKEKNDENFKLKWTEMKTAINFGTFKEGEQMVNHIPNCQLMTNKLGLITSLQEYERSLNNGRKSGKTGNKLKLSDFVPETICLDDTRGQHMFFNAFRHGDIWICKPTGRNQGKGIFLVREVEEIRQLISEHLPEPGRPSKPINRVIQRYISNPLLLDGKKFDIRCYMLIGCMVPYMVFYHKGYVRLSMYEYDNDCHNITTHLTNQFIQKRDPLYKDVKEETTWSMDRFNEYVNNHLAAWKGVQQDWVENVFEDKCKQLMTYVFNSIKNKLQAKIGYFALYGYDFMVDEDMNVFLIEVNINPCLAINCEALKERVPGVVKEAIYLSVECFEKARKGRQIMPLQSMKNFELIVNGSGKPTSGSPPKSTSKRTRSSSPSHMDPRKSKDDYGSKSDSRISKDAQRGLLTIRSKSESPLPRRARSLSPVKEVTREHGHHTKDSKSASLVKLDKPDKLERPRLDRPTMRGTVTPKATSLSGATASLPKSTSNYPPSRTKHSPEIAGGKDSTVSDKLDSPYAIRLPVLPQFKLATQSSPPNLPKRTKNKTGMKESKTSISAEDTQMIVKPNRGS